MGAMKIDSQAIKNLAELLTETGLTEIEIADGDKSIRVTRSSVVQAFAPPAAMPTAANNSAAPASAAPATSPVSFDKHPGAVKSPMVGTLYLKPDPTSKPFVGKGDKVKAGDTLFIIEAMKVMNPIKAEKGGTVTQILVDDASPIEYGEVIMVIE